MTDERDKMVQKAVNSMERHVRILKQSEAYDSDVVEEAVERWKNKQ